MKRENSSIHFLPSIDIPPVLGLLRGAASRESDSAAETTSTLTHRHSQLPSKARLTEFLLGLCLMPLCGRVADPVAVATPPPPPLGVTPPALDPVGRVLPAAARARSAARRGAPTRMGAEPRVAVALGGGTALDDAATRTAPWADAVEVVDPEKDCVVDDYKRAHHHHTNSPGTRRGTTFGWRLCRWAATARRATPAQNEIQIKC